MFGSATVAPASILQTAACCCKSQSPCATCRCSCCTAGFFCTTYCQCEAENNCENEKTGKMPVFEISDNE